MALLNTLIGILFALVILLTSAISHPTSSIPSFSAISSTSTQELSNGTHTVDITNLIVSRDAVEVRIGIESGPAWEVIVTTCVPNESDDTMCTISYIERSQWKGWAAVWVYDNNCNFQGGSDFVSREVLSKSWPNNYKFTSALPNLVNVWVDAHWNENVYGGLLVWYGSFVTQPFTNSDISSNFGWSGYEDRRIFPSNDLGQETVTWRVPFKCKGV